ncbi:MAG: carboxypeptidase-like regulatory domain-containing protein [Syntrophales bacterium]
MIFLLFSISIVACSGGGSASAGTYTVSGTISSGVSGVIVSIIGPTSNSTTTDHGGHYTFAVPNGSYTIIPEMGGYHFDPDKLSVAVAF